MRTSENLISSSENGWDAQKSNKKKVLKKKDCERNLHFPTCTPDVQAALRETGRTEWNKWMKFHAGVF